MRLSYWFSYTIFQKKIMQQNIGKRIVDISQIVEAYEAQEGEVQHIIGKTGQGKTYEATRRALQYLYSGYTVYTTWHMNIPDYYDEREHLWPIIRNIITFRREFIRLNLKENWHYVNLDSFIDSKGVMSSEALSLFLAKLTDCIFMLDEGQDVFDSHQRSGKIARQTITRTRHMHKTLIIISQRAQAVDVTARGNVTFFYKCEKVWWPFLPTFFRVYRTDEIDESNNYPLWVRHNSVGDVIWRAPIWHSGFARKKIYDAYDSWYMRKQQVRSQNISLEAYDLSMGERLRALMRKIPYFKPKTVIPISPELSPLSHETLPPPISEVQLSDERLLRNQGQARPTPKKRVTKARTDKLLREQKSVESE
jgi:hypothetical protein